MRDYIPGSKKRLAAAVGAALLSGVFSIVPVAEALPVLDAKDAAVSIATPDAVTMNITSGETNNLIKWVDFSIGKNESVNFNDTNNYLNYVTGSARSDILGTLTGGGHIYIVNPNGILIGDGATVNVGHLHLSTRNMTDRQLADFTPDGTSPLPGTIGGDVINLGTLNATSISVEGNIIKFRNVADVTLKDDAPEGSKINVNAGEEIRVGFAVSATPANNVNDNQYTNVTPPTLDNWNFNGKTPTEYMLVRNKFELQNVKNNNSGNYMLAGNIYMGDLKRDYTPIGKLKDGKGFTGHFDGLNYEIQDINITNREYFGLFAFNNGVIENFGLKGGSVKGMSGSNAVGGIVSYNAPEGTVRNVYNTANVTLVQKGYGVYDNASVGGIVGLNFGTLECAYNTGTVQGGLVQSDTGTGGIVGRNYGTIRQVFNTGNVSGTNAVGGIVGVNKPETGNSSVISDAYNTGTVSGDGNIGGIAGKMQGNASITNVYYSGTRGIVGYQQSGTTLTNAYTSANGNLKTKETFTGFDFSGNGVWRIYAGNTTPLLTAFLTRKDYYEEAEYNGAATGDVGLHRADSSHYETGIAQTGAKAFNYIKDYTEVTPKALTVSFGATAKEYDGTAAATAGTAALGGKVGNDDVSLDTANLAAVYDDENAGVNKTVTYSGIALTGGKAGNYRLAADTYIGTGAITRRALWLVADPVTITEGQATPTVWKGSVTGFIAGDGLGANDVCSFALDNPAAAAVGSYKVTGTLNGATDGEYGLNYTFANAAGNATAFTIKAYVPPTEPQDLFGGNEAAAREYKDTVVVLESTKAGTLPATAVLPAESVLPTYTDINMPESMSAEALAAALNGKPQGAEPAADGTVEDSEEA